MEFIGSIWNELIIRPMINSLVVLYYIAFSNFGLAIILFTIAIRAVLIPMTIKQAKQMKAMQSLQPKLKALQERYKNDKQKASSETMKLYREQGVNPLGCLGPMFIQFPIWIGLYRAITQTLPSTPEQLVGLSDKFYAWLPLAHQSVPLNGGFLGLNLADTAQNNPLPLVLPILVGVSMYVMQKMTTMPSSSAQQASTNKMLLWMMPIMFGFFTLNFPAGLAVYWVVSNIIGVVIQGFVTGWDPVKNILKFSGTPKPSPVTAIAASGDEEATSGEGVDRDDGENGRGRDRARPKGTRRRARRSRNRRR
jgi:YidC/Oxa1 family membrane protein insertase